MTPRFSVSVNEFHCRSFSDSDQTSVPVSRWEVRPVLRGSSGVCEEHMSWCEVGPALRENPAPVRKI